MCALAVALGMGVLAEVFEERVLPGRHLPVIEDASRLIQRADGEVLFVAGERNGQLIRGWQSGSFEVRTLRLGAEGQFPAGGAGFSADHLHLYWVDNAKGWIRVYSADDGTEVTERTIQVKGADGLPVRSVLGELAVSRDGLSLYVGDRTKDRVLAVDTASGVVRGVLPSVGSRGEIRVLGDRLFGMHLGRGGDASEGSPWMADIGSRDRPTLLHRWSLDRIWKHSMPGLVWASGDRVSGGIAVNEGALFVGVADSGALLRIDLASRKVVSWRVLTDTNQWGATVHARPQSLVVSDRGDRLYVAEAGLDAVTVYDARTLTILGHIPTPGYPSRVVLSADGGRLACLTLEGLTVAPAGGAAGVPEGGHGTTRPTLTVLEVPTQASLEAGRRQVLARTGLGSWRPRGASLEVPGSGTAPDPGQSVVANLPVLRLPIEVLGPGGTSEEARLTLTALEAWRADVLSLTIHGLQYDDKARLTINGRHTVSINSRTVKVIGNAQNYGGIGGGFHTIPIELDLPRGVLKEGENRFEFTYTRKDAYSVSGFRLPENRVDDASSGFRIIRFNLRDRQGAAILGPDRTEQDDPRRWTAPATTVPLAQAIEEGAMLWRGRKPDGTTFLLKNASGIGLTEPEMKATCTDCHAHDGRDLKYFNYSNHSIIARSRIHGLTEDEGRRIAAYIRTLPGAPVVPQARPWNPPFQPGPGLDSRPVYEWAAGAGLEAVVEDPVETFNGIFPGAYRKSPSGEPEWDLSRITIDPIQPTANLSIREVPISMQLLDWNHWLPKVHPIDGYAAMLKTNAVMQVNLDRYHRAYSNLVQSLKTQKGVTNYPAVAAFSRSALVWMVEARNSYPFDRSNHTLKEAQRRYPWMLLPLVKAFEIYTEYGLGDRVAEGSCGEMADERSWRVGTTPFSASPNISGLLQTRENGVVSETHNGHGIGNNTDLTFTYISAAWYHLQLILDHGNRNPLCGVNASSPMDWAYAMSVLKRLQGEVSGGANLSTIPLLYLYLAKGPQIYNTGLGVENSTRGGWQPFALMPYYLHSYSYGTDAYVAMAWKNIPPGPRGRLMDVLYEGWLRMNRESNPEQYYTPTSPQLPNSYAAYVEPGTRIGDGGPHDSLAERLHYLFTWKAGRFDGTLSGFGVSPALQNEILDWAQTIWPRNGDGTPSDWDSLRPVQSGR